MEMNYKPNSHKYKEAQKESSEKPKKVEKVVTGTVKKKKKSEMNKIKDMLISDATSNIKQFIIEDSLIPLVKEAIWNIGTGVLSMLMFGEEKRGTGSRSISDKIPYRNYNSISNRRDDRPSTKSTYNYDEIIVSTRGEAERVLESLDELLETYGMVSVADLYESVGITAPYTANRYGWTNLSSAKTKRVYEGYLLELPRAYPLDLH